MKKKLMPFLLVAALVISMFSGTSAMASTEGTEEPSAQTPIVTEITTDSLTDGTYQINSNGSYHLGDGLTAAITVANGVTDVTIIGNGVKYNPDSTDTGETGFGYITSTANTVTIDCTAAPGIHLTLQDLYNSINSSTYESKNMIDFSGSGNRLSINGTCLLDYDIGYKSSNNAGIHVAKGTSLTIDGSGTLYMYKNSQGAGIGGATREMNGDIVFNMTGYLFIKGTKQGAVIGAGSGASSTTDAPGSITFNSGTYNIITNSRGAAIGGSAGSTGGSTGTNVYVNGATLSINTDYSGAAVGGGGYAEGNDSSGGTMYVSGGSIRPYVDKNAASNVNAGWNGKKLTEGVNDAIITAQRLDGKGNSLYMCTVDLSNISADANGLYNIYVDTAEIPFYSGKGHSYVYAFDGIDRTTEASGYPLTTIANWIPEQDTNVYLYLTGTDHTLKINGSEYKYYWDAINETFSVEPVTTVAFNVYENVTTGEGDAAVTTKKDIEDVSVIVSKGIGYTYVEDTYKGVAFDAVEAVADDPATEDVNEAVEAQPAVTKYSLPAGTYTATITKDGYYASQLTFKVKEDGTVTSDSTNVKTYLDNTGAFSIPLTVFTPSTNANAWDGVTLDVSWYSEDKTELYVSTPAQLAGMAAIVNGIYNAEITTIIDDINNDLTKETYTPAEYATLDSRKIRAASSTGETGGANGANLVTTSTYWYGAKKEGTYTLDNVEVALPSDFNGKTVYITADLDMGGYQTTDGTWTGARYMTIGGQSMMHYIDYGTSYSDGYSHIGSSFNGTFDGQGHIVYNINCNRYAAGSNYGDSVSVALIGRLGNHDGDSDVIAAVDPTVKNVAVDGYIYGRRSVGGVVGKIGQTTATKGKDGSVGGIIENCVNFAEIVNTDAKGVGGICGAGWNKGIIKNCVNYGSVYAGRQNAGGIAGSTETPVINCLNVGYVDAIKYNQAQALGTDNGGAVYTNCYWLTGSSFADSVDTYQYPAVYRHDSKDTITEITTFAALTTNDFLKSLNGTGRAFVFASETDAIYNFLKTTTFENNKLDCEGVTAAGFPVPRVFINDTTSLSSIEKTSDPTTLAYVAGQSFDDTGLEIWATYSDGTKEQITDYTISVTDALTTDVTEVVISGTHDEREYTYTIQITVEERNVSSITIKTPPSNLLYAKDEFFDVAGLVVNAYYTDFPTKTVTLADDDYNYSLVGNTLTVIYKYNGKTVTASKDLDIEYLDTVAPQQNEEGTYLIACENDLIWFANQVNAVGNRAINALVTADLDMTKSAVEFTGIGTSSNYYAGTFNGGNHTIKLNMSGSKYSALFSYVGNGDATIKNVVVEGTVANTSTNAYSYTAGVVAYAYKGNITIDNCVNKASVSGPAHAGGILGYANTNTVVSISNSTNEGNVTGGAYVGGMAGNLATKESSISNCKNSGTITGTSKVSYDGGIGGIVGKGVTITISNCVNEGNVTGQQYVGGIAGHLITGTSTVSNCINNGNVDATGSYVGGIVGNLFGGNNKISQCGNSGNVKGDGNTAGVVGCVNVATDTIDSCYNAGNVASTGTYVAGVVASNKGIVKNSYNSGAVSGTATALTQYVGGIASYSYGNSKLENCYNAGALSYSAENTKPCYVGALVAHVYNINASVTCTNCYYLDAEGLNISGAIQSTKYAFTYNEDAAVTSAQLKALAATLGDAYKENTNTAYHGGYPVLTWEDVPMLYGDANGDGTVNSTDAMLILQYSSSVIDDTQLILSVSDVNGDDTVNSTDAMLVLQYSSGVITEFPMNAA